MDEVPRTHHGLIKIVMRILPGAWRERIPRPVQRSESSALAIMQQVRALCDHSAMLAARLQKATAEAGTFEDEIKGLSDLAESVQTISMQSHLLSINAAIEASRAGASGQAFKVVAQEVRELAASSHGAAARIGGSSSRIRAILKDGLEQNAARLTCDLEHIAETAQAVTQLQTSFDGMSGSYQARFADMLAQEAMHGLQPAQSGGAAPAIELF